MLVTLVVLATLLAALLIAVAAVLAVFDVDRSVGDRDYAVTTTQELDDEYRLGIGSLTLDLRNLQLPEGETHVAARVDLGDLAVLVPAGAGLEVHGTAEMGVVQLPGDREEDGRNVEVEMAEAGERVLVLDAHVGAGSVRVERAVP
jgi:predicted membrane protein